MHARREQLIIYYVSEMHEGLYEIAVRSPFQDAYARTKITVHRGLGFFIIYIKPPSHIVAIRKQVT